MRIFKYLCGHKIAMVLIVGLLAIQAFTELALPTLTSQIVDVGIQQSGVEHVATSELSEKTFNDVLALATPEDKDLISSSYDKTSSGTYALNEYGNEHRTELDTILAFPLIALHTPNLTSGFDAKEALASYYDGSITHTELLNEVTKAHDALVQGDGTILLQQGIAAASMEYALLGYDLADIQMNYLVSTGGLMLGFAALGMAIAIIIGYIASRTGAHIARDLRSKLFSRVVLFSDAEINRFSAASLITRGTNDIQLIQMVCIMLMRMVLYAPILAIGGIIMVMITNASLGWIIVVAIVAVFVLIVVIFGLALPKFKIMQKLIDKVNLVAREMLTGLPVVRAFGREDVEQKRFDKASEKLMRTQLFTNRVMTFMMPCLMLIMNATSIAIVWFGAHYIDVGTIQTGDLIAMITYSMVIIMGFLMIGMVAIILPRAEVAAERINEVLETEPSIKNPASKNTALNKSSFVKEAYSGKSDSKVFGARIEFKNVSFCYEKGSEKVLENISFVAEAGKTLAIIGSTGSGKSTIIKLIERFYDVTSGSITLDGVDITTIPQEELRSQLGYVPQKAFLFSGSIESNIAYSNRGQNRDDLLRAIDIAQAGDFVSSKEEGLSFEVSQGGTNVSGGQRQRLAIARALATNARAYLFDDSFSALDYKTDAMLRQRLAEDLKGATQIIVAQRIATIMHADNIVVLDDGKIVGTGTHHQLLKTCKEYKEIALSQFSEKELRGGDVCEQATR